MYRLLKFRSWLMKERRLSRDILKETGDSKYVTLHAYVDNTFKVFLKIFDKNFACGLLAILK